MIIIRIEDQNTNKIWPKAQKILHPGVKHIIHSRLYDK